ncbi:MAG: response regulator [Candidatus Obscuribacterales bacterium]|nr:response regulator [Candidatus Obscuribacterales bacterium]
MTKVWKAYVGQLKEKLDLINETLALTQDTGARNPSLAGASQMLRALLRQRENEQIATAEIFQTLNAAPEYHSLGIIATNLKGNITEANDRAREILGEHLLSFEADVDDTFFLADKATPCGRNLPWLRAAEGLEVSETKIFVKRAGVPDGLWLQIEAMPVKDSDGRVRCAIAIFADTTEGVLAESHIHDVRRQLEQRLTDTTNVHEELTELLGKMGQKNWDIVDSPEEIVLQAAEGGNTEEKLALVVDDVQVHHILLGSYLTNLGFAVHSATNGQAAVDAASKYKYSLILMDCDMPVMDGYEATKAIRKAEGDSRRVPIIAMTIYDRQGDREKCLAAGMDEYVTKSIDQTKLFKVAEAVLKGEPIVARADQAKDDDEQSAAREFDLPSLEKMYGRKELQEILPSFLKTTSVLIACLKAVIAERDVRAAHHYAHCIKGPAASLGCTKLASLCETVASAALRNKWFDADFEVDSLESAFEEIAKKSESLVYAGWADSGSSNDSNPSEIVTGEIELEKAAVASVADVKKRLEKLEQKIGKPTTLALANAFMEDTNDILDTMGGAITGKETEVVRRSMHKLAGCCASIMDSEGQKLARTVEELAVKQSWKALGAVYLTLCDSLLRTRQVLKDYAKSTPE